MESEFTAQLKMEGDLPVLELCGDINGFAEETLNEAFDAAEAQGGTEIRIDFGDVTYINSTGIALIVGLLARARKSRRAIVATGLNEHYREIFTITRLSDFMEIR
ncbi:MAG TPA: STAS domain-containing protein [Anaerolineales bacterium]|nr:STAS domain-containing protein [Anaerolineales bacterium]